MEHGVRCKSYGTKGLVASYQVRAASPTRARGTDSLNALPHSGGEEKRETQGVLRTGALCTALVPSALSSTHAALMMELHDFPPAPSRFAQMRPFSYSGSR